MRRPQRQPDFCAHSLLDAAAPHAQVPLAMADVDAELAERVARWCAEAGRQAGPSLIRRALAPLGWYDLLAVRALLADPPPARPLGPFALADIARGAPPDLAAERERSGRYPAGEEPEEEEPARGAPGAAPAAPPRGRGRRRRGAAVVIRRARDRVPAAPAPVLELPRVADLRRPEGRTVLERLIRSHGARRAALAGALGAGWRRDDGAAAGEEDLAALLEHHGLARTFARRERDELLHALRAAGGVRAAAAARLALDVAGLDGALAALGAAADAERIREERRAELRTRATLAERVRLLLAEEERLRDLGVLDEFEADLRARLPEHLRALRLGRAPLAEAFARSLSVEPAAAGRLAMRFDLELGPSRPAERRRAGGPRPRKHARGEAPRGRGRPSPRRPGGRRRG
jgi:hypothetical protein